jgi:hypothetical protein
MLRKMLHKMLRKMLHKMLRKKPSARVTLAKFLSSESCEASYRVSFIRILRSILQSTFHQNLAKHLTEYLSSESCEASYRVPFIRILRSILQSIFLKNVSF